MWSLTTNMTTDTSYKQLRGRIIWYWEIFFSSTMLAINSIVANALLFSSLLLVIGVPVFYMTQTNPEDNRNPNIKKIEILAGVWFHLVLLQALVGEYITHQMSV